jgi:hypothetical protein
VNMAFWMAVERTGLVADEHDFWTAVEQAIL